MKFIFNPEHDLCLANGSPTFVPPDSALKFGRDCRDILDAVFAEEVQDCGAGDSVLQGMEGKNGLPGGFGVPEEGGIAGGSHDASIIPWGWDNVLRHNLLKAGIPAGQLPSDKALEEIRRLSHRRIALQAGKFIRERLADSSLSAYLVPDLPEELDRPEMVRSFLERQSNAVFKAPWSGSGKGLRWVRRNEFSHSDEGWCRNVIEKQGSVIAERREEVVCNFAMLFRVTEDSILFEGYSLFDTDNGAYRSNILASNEYILSRLSRLIPLQVLTAVQKQLSNFLKDNFVGKYEGFLGVDMFICRCNAYSAFGSPDPTAAPTVCPHNEIPGTPKESIHAPALAPTESSTDSDRYLLAPCVEINVRMTMGLLARKYFDRHIRNSVVDGNGENPSSFSNPDCIDGISCCDGRYRFTVVYSNDIATLRKHLAPAIRILTQITDTTQYAIAIFRNEA